jgi:hypothetical protein
MTHVRTSPYYPQSNGKAEAWNKTVKVEAIRPVCPETMDEVQQEMLTAEDSEREEAVVPSSVEEAPLLSAVHRIVRGVEIEDDLRRGMRVGNEPRVRFGTRYGRREPLGRSSARIPSKCPDRGAAAALHLRRIRALAPGWKAL